MNNPINDAMHLKLTRMFKLYVRALRRREELMLAVPHSASQIFQMTMSHEMQLQVARACMELDIDGRQLKEAAISGGLSANELAAVERVVAVRKQHNVPARAAEELMEIIYLPLLEHLEGKLRSTVEQMSVTDLVKKFRQLEAYNLVCRALAMFTAADWQIGDSPMDDSGRAFVNHGITFVTLLGMSACELYSFELDNLNALFENDERYPQITAKSRLEPLMESAGVERAKGSPNRPEDMAHALPFYVAELVNAAGNITAILRARCGIGVHSSRIDKIAA